MTLKTLIVDDEPSGRKVLQEYAADVPFLQLAGTAENPMKAQAVMNREGIDLLFLDIQMPKMNGLDFLKSLPHPPLVVLSTAFPQYALQGFEMDVVDYLLKPVSFERFCKACKKALEMFNARRPTAPPSGKDYIFVKHNTAYEKVRVSDIVYVEALENFVRIRTGTQQFVVWLTLKQVEEALPHGQFVKTHRSFLVSLDKIERFTSNAVIADGHRIPVSRSLRAEVEKKVLGPHLLKR